MLSMSFCDLVHTWLCLLMLNIALCLCRHDWDVKLQETLGSSHVLAYSCRQGCLQLSVFIRRDLIWFCCGESNL